MIRMTKPDIIYQHIAKNMNIGCVCYKIITNKKGKPIDIEFIDINHKFENLMRVKAKDIVGKNFAKVLSAGEKKYINFHKLLQRIALTGKTDTIEHFIEPFNQWFLIQLLNLGNNTYVILLDDITQRKQAEEKAFQLSEQWHLTFDAVTDGIFISDDKYHIIRWNKALEHIAKKKPDQCKSCSCWEIVHGLKKRYKDCLILHAKKSLHRETMEVKIGNRDYQVVVDPILDKNRKFIGAVHILTDITEYKRTQDELRKSEEKYRIIFESANDAIVVLDPSGRTMSANKKAFQLTGLSEKDLGSHISEYNIFPPRSLAIIQEKMKARLLGKEVGPYEVEMHPKNGKPKIIEVSASVLRDVKGTVVSDMVIMRDVTERKHVFTALQKSEGKYRSLIQGIDIGVWRITADLNGKILEANPAMARMFGFSSPEELKQFKPIDLYQIPSDRKAFLERISKFESVKAREHNFKKKDGTPIVVSITASAHKDEHGKIDWIDGVIEDITERKRKEQTLHEQANMLELAHDAILVRTLDGEIVFWNQGAERIYGWTKEEALGRNTHTFLHTIFPVSKKAMEDEIRKNNRWQGELTHIRRDGVTIVVDSRQVLHRDSNGQPIGILEINRDITEHKKAETALKQSEEKYRSLVKNVNIGIFRTKSKGAGRFIEVNPALVRMFGYTSDKEFMRLSPYDLYLNPNDRTVYLKKLKKYGFVSGLELKHKKKDGAIITVSLTTRVHHDEKGKIDWVDGVIEDISERKKDEQKLRSEYDKFRGMLSAMEQGVDIVNKDYIIEFQNKLLKERFGDKCGEKCYVVYMGLKEPCDICMIHKAIGTGKTTRAELVGADGRNYEVNSSPFTDVDGEVKVIELVRDITEQKRAEEILRESEGKYRSLVKNVNIGIFRTEPAGAGRFIEVNPALVRMLGYTSEKELMHLSPTDLYLNPNDRADYLNKLKKHGFVTAEELKFRKKKGAIFMVSVTARVHRDEKGKIDWIDGVIEDITERKHAEEELTKHRLHLEELVQERTKQIKNTNEKLEGELVVHKRLEEEIERHASQLEVANKELDAFAYSVSHDLRAPLRSINGFSTALFEDYSNKLDDQGKNYIARVRTATHRMEQLIDDLLALSKITRSTMQYADVDLSRIVKDIVAEFCEREPKRKVKVKISPNITVTGDPDLLRIVLFNLLDNAWKFTGKKQNPEIEFGVMEHAKRKTYFVRDNGVGFDMTYVDKLFTPFQRLHGTSEFAGTGIGLATVKRIILRHSGNVWGEGKVGRGATFYFTL